MCLRDNFSYIIEIRGIAIELICLFRSIQEFFGVNANWYPANRANERTTQLFAP